MAVIALLEPSVIIRESLAALLRSNGHKVEIATDLEHLQDVVAQYRCTAIVFEPLISTDTPAQAIRNLRSGQWTSGVPLFVLTDCSDRAQILEMVEAGITTCLLKSHFTARRMLSRLNQTIRGGSPQYQPVSSSSTSRGKPLPTQLSTDDNPTPEMPAIRTAKSIEHNVAAKLSELKPIVSRSELQDRVSECSDLRALSPAVNHILSIARKPDSSIDSVIKAVRCDHAIALKLIRLSNSSVYARGEPVSSVRDAVLRIGLHQIISVVTSVGIIDRFSSSAVEGLLNHMSFWEHSIATALTASELARECRISDADEMFTCGILHDVGRMIFANAIGEEYAQVLKTARSFELQTEVVEKRMLLYTHADLMAGILNKWSLPRNLIDPIVNHHLSIGNIRSVCPKRVAETGVLALANRLVHSLGIGSSGNCSLYSIHDFCAALKVPNRVIAQIENTVPDSTDDLKLSMLSDSGILEPAKCMWADANPPLPRTVFLSANQAVDSIRIAMESIKADELSGQIPELAVLHVHHSREVTSLFAELQKIEALEQIGPLPTLIISASGNQKFAQSTSRPRKVLQVALPATRPLIAAHLRNLVDSILQEPDRDQQAA